jgi:hypothetical protein
LIVKPLPSQAAEFGVRRWNPSCQLGVSRGTDWLAQEAYLSLGRQWGKLCIIWQVHLSAVLNQHLLSSDDVGVCLNLEL